MYFVNVVVKALLVELLCLTIIDANGMFYTFLLYMIIIIIISFFVFNFFFRVYNRVLNYTSYSCRFFCSSSERNHNGSKLLHSEQKYVRFRSIPGRAKEVE